MSAFSPDIPVIPRPSQEQLLARFVPAALRRSPPTAKVWPLWRQVVTGVVTAGLWPFWPLRQRIARTLELQGRQCELAADYLRSRIGADDARLLTDAARSVNARRGTSRVEAVLWWVGVVAFGVWAARQPSWVRAVWPLWHERVRSDVVGMAGQLALSAAYLLVIVRIDRQLLAMQRFALAFNAIFEDRVPAIEPPSLVWGVSPSAVVAGGVGAWLGPVWLLPMMMVWSAHSAAARGAAYAFRVRLADRLVRLSGTEPVVPTADVCGNPDCRHGLPHGAKFCPRCGRPAAA